MKKTIAALLLLSVLAGLCCCKKPDEKKVPAFSAAGTPAGLVNSLSTPSAEAPLHGRNIYGKMVLYQETVYYDYAPATSENLDNTEIHAVALGQGEAPVCILQDARIDSLTGSLLIAYRYKEGRYYGLNLEKGEAWVPFPQLSGSNCYFDRVLADGQALLFGADEGEQRETYVDVVDLNTLAVTRRQAPLITSACFSGDTLYYFRQGNGAENSVLCRADLTGKKEEILYQTEDLNPKLFAAGDRLFWCSEGGSPWIYHLGSKTASCLADIKIRGAAQVFGNTASGTYQKGTALWLWQYDLASGKILRDEPWGSSETEYSVPYFWEKGLAFVAGNTLHVIGDGVEKNIDLSVLAENGASQSVVTIQVCEAGAAVYLMNSVFTVFWKSGEAVYAWY